MNYNLLLIFLPVSVGDKYIVRTVTSESERDECVRGECMDRSKWRVFLRGRPLEGVTRHGRYDRLDKID